MSTVAIGHRESSEVVDEEHEAPLEARCECGGEIVAQRVEDQYQGELPDPRPIRRRFRVHIGKFACCGRRNQGRRPFRASDAVDAARCMLVFAQWQLVRSF
ncbi:MAG: hypothetical protein ACRDMJ_20190 [Solirubrobacteraceae bacterium]